MSLKISVITVSFNQSQWIEECIRSVYEQNYPNVEHIIVDGGSNDGTVEILKKYPHLLWTSEPDEGQSDALNKGFRKATGDIIAWVNSDDAMCEGSLEAIDRFFSENPDKYVVVGNQVLIDENSKILRVAKGKPFSEEWLLNGVRSAVTQNSTVFRKEVFEKVGYLDESFHYSMDRDLFIRLAHNYKIYAIDKDLAKFRLQSESKTCTSKLKFYNDLKRIRKKYNAPFNFKMWLWIEWQYIKEPFRKIPFLRRTIGKYIKY